MTTRDNHTPHSDSTSLTDNGIFVAVLHSHKSAAHDHICGVPGDFARTALKMRRLADIGRTVISKTIIHHSNYMNCVEIVKAAAALGSCVHTFEYAKTSAVPRMPVVFPFVLAALRATLPDMIEIASTGIPPCVYVTSRTDLSRMTARETRLFAMPGAGCSHIASCERCSLKDSCPGPPDTYLDSSTQWEFTPLPPTGSAT